MQFKACDSPSDANTSENKKELIYICFKTPSYWDVFWNVEKGERSKKLVLQKYEEMVEVWEMVEKSGSKTRGCCCFLGWELLRAEAGKKSKAWPHEAPV